MQRRQVATLVIAVAALLTLTGAQLFSPEPGGAGDDSEWRGPDSRYLDYDEIMDLYTAWDILYPDIFHREIIGYGGVDGEPIWAVRISDNASTPEDEARVIIHAAQHANEANGINVCVFMMERLLTRYGVQSYYTNLVNDLEMWFVPIVNTDGHRIVFEGGSNWDWWRKSKRDNDHNGQYTFPHDGVDTNRNWDFRWAEYDSTDYWSSRYKGPYPFSEDCVVATRDFVLRERPVVLMDLHSPDVPSIGNKIWWPWYDPNTYQTSIDDDMYQPLSTQLGYNTQTESGGYYAGAGACYNTTPKEQTWVYKNTGICALLMEISLQFWWTGATVDTIAARTGRGLFYLMDRAQTGPGLTGKVTNAMTGQPVIADIKVAQYHDANIGPRLTEASHGKYWRLLLGGQNYSVTVTADGYDPISTTVYVGSSGWTERNFQLQPDPAGVDEPPVTASRVLWADGPLTRGGSAFFRLAEPADVRLDLLDISGRFVASLASGHRDIGVHRAAIDRSLPSGNYLLRLRAGEEQWTSKVMLVD